MVGGRWERKKAGVRSQKAGSRMIPQSKIPNPKSKIGNALTSLFLDG